jgi:hypothetical protein
MFDLQKIAGLMSAPGGLGDKIGHISTVFDQILAETRQLRLETAALHADVRKVLEWQTQQSSFPTLAITAARTEPPQQ